METSRQQLRLSFTNDNLRTLSFSTKSALENFQNIARSLTKRAFRKVFAAVDTTNLVAAWSKDTIHLLFTTDNALRR